MNFRELQDELFDRGTNYLEDTGGGTDRAARWLNQAYQEILAAQSWPFLHTVAVSGLSAGFITIPDLRKILLVTNLENTTKLRRVSLEDLVAEGHNVNDTGIPEYYWTVFGQTVNAYPVGGTLQVNYIKRVSPMSGTDEPIFDAQYHDLIVDRAMVKAYKDTDNFEAAAALMEEFNLGLRAMTEDYMMDSRDVTFIPVMNPRDG
jgi:hypothetical protein